MQHRDSWNVSGPITKQELSVWEGSVITASGLSTKQIIWDCCIWSDYLTNGLHVSAVSGLTKLLLLN